MRRIASNYIITTNSEKLRLHVVEIEDGCVINTYPLTHETEAVEWLPGAIEIKNCNNQVIAVHMYPFDFISMKPVDETQHTLLK